MYTEVHRVLLTYIRSVKSVKLQDLLDAFVLICQRLGVEEEPTLNLLNQYIADINIQISQQGFKIERKNDENDGSTYFIFINTIVDEIMKESSMYTTSELVSIRGIIEDIIDARNFAFSTTRTQAQQIISAHQNKGIKDSAAFVDKLIDDGWFDATLNDHLILSVKSLCELKQYLIDGYGTSEDEDDGKLLLCRQCKEIVTMGLLTSEKIPFHRKCYEVYCRNNNNNNNNDLQPTEQGQIRVGPDPSTL
ncbi:hypothetical protein KGF57_004874 [Candida theae]|uniref:Non-structural maintenance of chromosomes element 1 homolog n=1 Tax=Candida theae TaxID=1198502 RepID=A0AAD5FW96_9ASCO|nr:uncharacterized protein KGF57_004874 [Candida theae]KAI5949044.1 hypothetical protein KGF57_004874 [Candida theae]